MPASIYAVHSYLSFRFDEDKFITGSAKWTVNWILLLLAIPHISCDVALPSTRIISHSFQKQPHFQFINSSSSLSLLHFTVGEQRVFIYIFGTSTLLFNYSAIVFDQIQTQTPFISTGSLILKSISFPHLTHIPPLVSSPFSANSQFPFSFTVILSHFSNAKLQQGTLASLGRTKHQNIFSCSFSNITLSSTKHSQTASVVDQSILTNSDILNGDQGVSQASVTGLIAPALTRFTCMNSSFVNIHICFVKASNTAGASHVD